MLIYVYMKILDMTKMASVVIVAVVLLRLLLKRLPKLISYAMWAAVLFRLLCPFHIEVPVSVMPEITPVEEMYTLAEVPIAPSVAAMAAYRAVGDALNGGLGSQYIRTKLPPEEGTVVSVVTSTWWEVWILFGQYVWLAGILMMMGYAVVSYVRLRRKLVTAMPLQIEGGHVSAASAQVGTGYSWSRSTPVKEGQKEETSKHPAIYQADEISSPFVMGLFRPKIYLPSGLSEQEIPYILVHEQHHIRRGDHVIKLLAFAALCLHWFNPLVWVAFVLAGKDMEMSCDEAVIKEMGEDVLADYAATLLSLATGRSSIVSMPLAFGEGDPKGRIHNLARWKKPAIWISAAVVTACAVFAVVLLTNSTPKKALRMENGREFVDLVPGTTYDSKECVYMVPHSCYYPAGGNTGLYYIVEEDGLRMVSKSDADDRFIEVESWNWQEFPYSDQEWKNMYIFGMGVENISELYEQILYQPLSEGEIFLNMDGELWLVNFEKDSAGTYIHSIFRLVPVE